MTDRERVIKGFECCRPDGCCFDCPYDDGIAESMSCKQQWADDALALLNEDEKILADYRRWHENQKNTIESLLKTERARLLTMDEITGDGECWLECRNGACGYADIYITEIPGVLRAWMAGDERKCYLSIDKHGLLWRCWSHKPRDEQREATPWD